MKVNGNQVRLESNADMRELPVVEDGKANDVGGMHAVPAPGSNPQGSGVPADTQQHGVRGMAPDEHASGQ
jgi:hypothetical protein